MKRAPIKVVKKPWGREIWYALHSSYVGKILVIEKGKRLSRQYHKVKHETIYALKGDFHLELGRWKGRQRQGSAAVIPPGTVHRFEARYSRVTLLEVSTPQLQDVVRLSDDYGRVKKR
ncbi:MAG: cupin domain-containing protein [Elusimicrobia bacterium]|nr:cupin domain-containing protein [Elusimicrobiota bacterium]